MISIEEKVTELVNKWDPIGFFPMAPKDEYDGEIRKICEYIFNNTHIEATLLANYINDTFIQSFGKDIYKEDMKECKIISGKILFYYEKNIKNGK